MTLSMRLFYDCDVPECDYDTYSSYLNVMTESDSMKLLYDWVVTECDYTVRTYGIVCM